MWGGWRSGNKWPVITMKLEIPETCHIVIQDNTNKSFSNVLYFTIC